MNKIWISVLFNTRKKRTRLSLLKKMDKSELRQDEMDEPFFTCANDLTICEVTGVIFPFPF